VPELRERAGASAVLVRRGAGRYHRARPDRIERRLRLRRLHLRELILASVQRVPRTAWPKGALIPIVVLTSGLPMAPFAWSGTRGPFQ
jgi:hypothetical protein